MEFDRFGDDGDPTLLVVLGWGNRTHHEPVRWLIDHFSEGFHVHTATLPVHVTDVQAEWVRPVERYAADLDSPALLGHSAGGLTAAHADVDARTRTYLSPWWGFHADLDNPLVSALMKLPISRPILPASATREDLGELASDEWLEDAPDYAAPTFLREAKRAQERMPPFDTDDAVFYSPTDPIVGAGAIESQVPASNRVSYEGGHELFCSRSRDDHIDTVLAAVDEGADAL